MNNDANKDIKPLTDKLEKLRLQSQPNAKVNTNNTKNTRIVSSTRSIPHFIDRYGKTIQIGDKVAFLTKTKFKGTQGTVTRFTRKRVISENSEGREVVKERRILAVIKNT